MAQQFDYPKTETELRTLLDELLSGKLIAAPNCKLKQTFWNQPLLKQSHCLLVIQHDI